MENTYLALLPFELQDLIFKKVVREQKKDLHAELIYELSNDHIYRTSSSKRLRTS